MTTPRPDRRPSTSKRRSNAGRRREHAPAQGEEARRPLKQSMHVRVSLWIENDSGELLFGEGRQQILQAIQNHGSLTAAAESLSMSYRGLWARIRNSEKRLGAPLVESRAGRGPDSGTALSPQGRVLLAQFTSLREEVAEATTRAFDRLFGGRSAASG